MTSFSFFKYFDAFELDVNVANFVYYGKTRIYHHFCIIDLISFIRQRIQNLGKVRMPHSEL